MPASDHRCSLTLRVRRDGDYWLATARGQHGTGETRYEAVADLLTALGEYMQLLAGERLGPGLSREYDALRAWAGEGGGDG